MNYGWILVFITIVFLTAFFLSGPIMSDVEKPNYEVINSDSNIEIRSYEPMIVAEVTVSGEREDAIGDGFRLIADYIFGQNEESKKIAMTAPVQQQSAGKMWNVNFVMPSEYTMDSLPSPQTDRIDLKYVPEKNFVVIRFSGRSSKRNLSRYEKTLKDYIIFRKIHVVGPVKYAFYNPPWTVPFMRRNELMIEIKE